MNNLPLALQIAALSTSLDKIKIIPADRDVFNKSNGGITRVRVWLPGLRGNKIAKKCAYCLNEHIDNAIDDYNSTEMLIGVLAMPVHHNLLYADIDMEFLFK